MKQPNQRSEARAQRSEETFRSIPGLRAAERVARLLAPQARCVTNAIFKRIGNPLTPTALSRAVCLSLFLVFATGVSFAQTAAAPPNGWVVLPIAEYQALRRAAFPADAEPAPPPVEATLTRIDYDLKVDGDLASGEARLTIDVIKNGWVRLRMPEGLMVREAQLDGQQVTLVTRPADKESGGNELLLSRTGRSVLTL